MVNSNLNPAWSVDTHKDFVVLQIDLSGTPITSAFGFGSTTGSNEQSHSLVYIEADGAAVVPFLAKSAKCMYVAKVTMATGGSAWSKKVCIASSWTNPRYLTYDLATHMLYFTSDYAN